MIPPYILSMIPMSSRREVTINITHGPVQPNPRPPMMLRKTAETALQASLNQEGAETTLLPRSSPSWFLTGSRTRFYGDSILFLWFNKPKKARGHQLAGNLAQWRITPFSKNFEAQKSDGFIKVYHRNLEHQ